MMVIIFHEVSIFLVVFNFTPNVIDNYRVGVPAPGTWKEVFNSDNQKYGGSNVVAENPALSQPIPYNGQQHSIEIKLAPLAAQYWTL